MMKHLKKLFALCLALALCLSLGTVTLAAPVAEATIDTSRTGSLDIYKYDFTNAAKDGVWDSSTGGPVPGAVCSGHGSDLPSFLLK